MATFPMTTCILLRLPPGSMLNEDGSVANTHDLYKYLSREFKAADMPVQMLLVDLTPSEMATFGLLSNTPTTKE